MRCWSIGSGRLCLALVLLVGTGSIASAAGPFAYNDTINNSGFFFLNGGATNTGGTTITRLVADDITPAAGFAGLPISSVLFSVVNTSSADIAARARIRFYGADGPGGGPGTLIQGFSLPPAAPSGFTPGLSFFQFSPSDFIPGGMNVPGGTFWLGVTFDNFFGGLSASEDELNHLGMGLFSPPAVGSSADRFFVTSEGGSFLNNNPTGALGDFGGNPTANFYFGITVPEPGSAALLGLGLLAVAWRKFR